MTTTTDLPLVIEQPDCAGQDCACPGADCTCYARDCDGLEPYEAPPLLCGGCGRVWCTACVPDGTMCPVCEQPAVAPWSHPGLVTHRLIEPGEVDIEDRLLAWYRSPVPFYSFYGEPPTTSSYGSRRRIDRHTMGEFILHCPISGQWDSPAEMWATLLSYAYRDSDNDEDCLPGSTQVFSTPNQWTEWDDESPFWAPSQTRIPTPAACEEQDAISFLVTAHTLLRGVLRSYEEPSLSTMTDR